MNRFQLCIRLLATWIAALLVTFTPFAATAPAGELELRKGDHICLVGNALGERMQHQNYWETALHLRFPQHQLVVRNLCFPGDEPLNRLRSLNFGDPDSHLTHSKASVILFFFGFNESFRGEAGLPSFTADLTQLVNHTKKQNYSGQGPPRIVLVSPAAFEDTGDANLPAGAEHNRRLKMYTAAMRAVAKETEVGFADLFTPSHAVMSARNERLTLDGAHLNAAGHRLLLGPLLNEALFGTPDSAYPADTHNRLRGEIADKNFHWWHRYRAVNGYSIYGTRGQAGSDGTYRNRDVMERERAILDQMTANRDRRIWAIAAGRPPQGPATDDNTLPFIRPKTNVGGANDPNRRAGKLGSLDYLSSAEQLKRFKLAPGYAINLVASEEDFPELANPVALNFDSKGRLWVATMQSYPQWQPKTKLDDKLLIFEDPDGDGRADRCKVFSGGLHQPTGFELGHGGVYVAQQPDVLFLKDTDGDDQADSRIRRLIGFDTADSHHGLADFEWGPGGGLYFMEGTFKQSQVESPYGLTRLGDAGVWRFEPRTAKFGVHVSCAFANPWGHVFDRWGQNFIADASPGNNYWATPISGYVQHPDKHPGGGRGGRLDFGGSKSDKPYPTFIKKRVRPSAGCEIVSSRHFPPEAQGNFLVNNVIGERGVLQHKVNDAESGFSGVEVEPLVMCEDGNFRPVALQFGPDGALYIVDWHNALIGHLQHNLREPNRDHKHGRIWRVTYKGRDLVKPPKIAEASVTSLLELLKEPEDRTRYRARRELAARTTTDVIPVLSKWIAGLDESHAEHQHHLLEALWVHQSHNVVNRRLLERLLRSPDFRARAAATRVLCYWGDRIADDGNLLAERLNDEHPRPRLEAVRACSFTHTPESFRRALQVLRHPLDSRLEYTLDETLRVIDDMVHARHMTGSAADDPPAGHQHGQSAATHAPLLFLDESPKLVRYQLDRLSNAQLLAVKISPGDGEFKPVLTTLLSRRGLTRQERARVLAQLTSFRQTDPVAELLTALQGLDRQASARPVANQLTRLMLTRPAKELQDKLARFRKLTSSSNLHVATAAYAALLAAGANAEAWKTATQAKSEGLLPFLAAVPQLVLPAQRSALWDKVVECLGRQHPIAVRRAAVRALAAVPANQDKTFRRVARLVRVGPLRATAVRTLETIPQASRNAGDARAVVDHLVALAEKTPPARRTTPDFLDAMQLADNLLVLLPAADARAIRSRMRKTVVRVVRINTVEEEMRYDTPYFAVQAGRPVQLVLRNEDLMPHNLVITVPGKMREVAELGATLPPVVDRKGRQYTPKTKDVLFATGMVPPHRQDVLTFTAPNKPGEYPFVCTFPRHWMRMYGVMIVVDDLEAWQAKPTKPTDPLGQNRELVQNWKLEDLQGRLDSGLRGRTAEIGRRIFTDASCLQCHKLRGTGGAVGPDLTDVLKRFKGDRVAVLREIIEPSHKIDPQFTLYNILTIRGKVISGIVTSQNGATVTVVSNPEKPEPQVIPKRTIDEMIKTPTSLMPKGLLDRFTEDEIFEMLAYILGPS